MKINIAAFIGCLYLCLISAEAQQVIILTDSTEVPELNLEEITVNASKSNLTLKKLPASVTLLPAELIQQNEVQNLTDVASLTPGFFMPDYGSKLTSPVYIRGIGSRINSPSVGLYVDQVPYFEKAAYNFDFFDIERIEILKGPQGTLYGRNAMGGIVNIITRSPLDHQGTAINLSAGTFGNAGLSVSHHNKPGESFGYSISANYLYRNGYYYNSFLDNMVDQMNSLGLRNKLILKPSDAFTITNIASFENSIEGGYPYALFNDSLQLAEEINYNQVSSYSRKMFSNATILEFEGRSVDLRATTSYQFLDDKQEIDQDFTPDSAYYVVQDQAQHLVSQEVIVKAKKERQLNWLFGAYGFMQEFDKQVDVDIYKSAMRLMKGYDTRILGGAIFHQSIINDLFIENLSLTAGIRLDLEKDLLDYMYDRKIGEAISPVSDTLYPALEYTQVLPKLALNYSYGKGSVYGLVAKGYKTGGFNSTFYRDEDLFFLPEHSWNYELGLKTSMLDRRVYLDLSLFYIDWSNQQIYQPAVYADGSPAPGSMLKNAGKSVSKGGEVTVKTLPFWGIKPMISYGYTLATFTSHYVNETTDYSGNYIPYIPKNTLTVQLSKMFELPANAVADRIRLNMLYRGTGDIYWNEQNSFKTGYYNLLDAKVAFINGKFSLEFWAKNLLNTEYESFYFEAIGNQYVQIGKPFRLGMNLIYDF